MEVKAGAWLALVTCRPCLATTKLGTRPTLLLEVVSLRPDRTGVELNKWAADMIYGKRAFHFSPLRLTTSINVFGQNGLSEKGTTDGHCFRFHRVLQVLGGTFFAVAEVLESAFA